jgi:tRNA 5-methylaminomethyl-2-thiouridine biosynthesis bifunctional protein
VLGRSPPHAAIIGCGLAGAATAIALAKLGWRITVYESGGNPASGASALPVGMLSPHHTTQPTPLSRLTALGLSVTRSHLQTYLPEGQGWVATSVENFKQDERQGLPVLQGVDTAHIIEPSCLIEAWLDHARALTSLELCTQTPVTRLHFDAVTRRWNLISTTGTVLAVASHVVVANAHAAPRLLETPALGLRPVAGQITLGPSQMCTDDLKLVTPKRFSGVYVPHFTTRAGAVWSVGATYRRGSDDLAVRAHDRAANHNLLTSIAPEAIDRWSEQAKENLLQDWVGVRCASIDRMPLVGAMPFGIQAPIDPSATRHHIPTPPGLYGLLALGSRGLSLAPLLGEVLAAKMNGDPSPLPLDLEKAVDPRRALLQSARQALKTRR